MVQDFKHLLDSNISYGYCRRINFCMDSTLESCRDYKKKFKKDLEIRKANRNFVIQ